MVWCEREKEKKKRAEREREKDCQLMRWYDENISVPQQATNLKKKVLIKRQNKPAIFHAAEVGCGEKRDNPLPEGFIKGWRRLFQVDELKSNCWTKNTSKKNVRGKTATFTASNNVAKAKKIFWKNTRERRDTKESPEVYSSPPERVPVMSDTSSYFFFLPIFAVFHLKNFHSVS